MNAGILSPSSVISKFTASWLEITGKFYKIIKNNYKLIFFSFLFFYLGWYKVEWDLIEKFKWG